MRARCVYNSAHLNEKNKMKNLRLFGLSSIAQHSSALQFHAIIPTKQTLLTGLEDSFCVRKRVSSLCFERWNIKKNKLKSPGRERKSTKFFPEWINAIIGYYKSALEIIRKRKEEIIWWNKNQSVITFFFFLELDTFKLQFRGATPRNKSSELDWKSLNLANKKN